MKITSIKKQVHQQGRYSIFIEGKYTFSLSDTALLESKLVNGQDLSEENLRELEVLANQDKILSQAINYATLRPHSKWEIEQYIIKKKCPPALSETILNKLSVMGYVDDKRFAKLWVESRLLRRPTSLRKLEQELKLKHIDSEVIQVTLSSVQGQGEAESIKSLVITKMKQSRYQDKTKLMQYLSRQGYNYGDIKDALADIDFS